MDQAFPGIKLVNELPRALLLSGLCALVTTGVRSDDIQCSTDIKALMTPEQFHEAGLEKLTAAERQALDNWLQSLTCGDSLPVVVATPAAPSAKATPALAVPATAKVTRQPKPGGIASAVQQPIPAAQNENFGFPDPLPDTSDESNQLHARVVGKFRGWSGKTVFTLDNGQVWRQRISGRYTYTGEDTRVVISQNRFGFYDMRLVAADRSVGVSRIK